MNFQNNKYVFDIAKPEDGAEILEILEDNDFDGGIALLYTRRPDAYVSFHLEGKDTEIVVCRDVENNKLAGFGACSIRRLYLNGEEVNVGYLFGLRVRKEYRRLAPIIPQGYIKIREAFKDKDVRCYITTILEENLYAQKVLSKKRAFMPEYIPLNSYGTFILKTGIRVNVKSGFTLRVAEEKDLPELINFYKTHVRKNQFFPVIDSELLSGETFAGLKREQFYILLDKEDKIAACGAIWDQGAYKQYILKGYNGIFKLLYPISPVLKLFGFPSLPKPGKMLEFFTLSFWVVRDNDENTFKTFIKLISNCKKEYPFFVVGMSSENPLIDTVKSFRHISYWSKAYLVDWNKDGSIAGIVKGLPIYLECGLL